MATRHTVNWQWVSIQTQTFLDQERHPNIRLPHHSVSPNYQQEYHIAETGPSHNALHGSDRPVPLRMPRMPLSALKMAFPQFPCSRRSVRSRQEVRLDGIQAPVPFLLPPAAEGTACSSPFKPSRPSCLWGLCCGLHSSTSVFNSHNMTENQVHQGPELTSSLHLCLLWSPNMHSPDL